MSKDNLKARLAYSTISQLSYVVLGAVLASATVDAGEWMLLGVLLLSSLLSMGYLLTVPMRAFSRATGEGEQGDGAGERGGGVGERGDGEAWEIREAPPACLVAILVTAGGCVALFLYPDPFFALVSQVAGGR